MYIQETTQSQRVTISVALDGMFGKVARAHRLPIGSWTGCGMTTLECESSRTSPAWRPSISES